MNLKRLIIILLAPISIVNVLTASSSSSCAAAAASSSKAKQEIQETAVERDGLKLYKQPELTFAQQSLNIGLLGASGKKDGKKEVLKYLQLGADVNYFYMECRELLITPLEIAIYNGCVDIATELLKNKPPLKTTCMQIADMRDLSTLSDQYLKAKGFNTEFIADFRAYANSEAGKNKAVGYNPYSKIIFKTK